MSDVENFAVPPVIKTLELPVSAAEAFEHYVRGLPAWFPIDKFFAGDAPPKECRVEMRLNGRLYEVTQDGAEVIWGRFVAWDPPHRLAYTWQVGTSADKAQLVELEFAETLQGSTLTLRHSGWEKLGEEGVMRRERYNGGWEMVLQHCYRAYVIERTSDQKE